MLKNHIKIAWRSLKGQPFFTILNTFGLAIGMAGALLLALFVYDELTHDKMFTDAERIYRIDADIKFGGAEFAASQAAAPMAEVLRSDFPEVAATVRLRDRGSALIKKSGTKGNVKENAIAFADSTFLSFFGVDMLAGDRNTALAQPKTIVLTRTAAEKHFGIQNAVGQKMLLNNTDTYTVTGVIEDFPKNSILRAHTIFMAMVGHPAALEDNWGGNNFYTFVKLIPKADIGSFEARLKGLLKSHVLPWAQKFFPGMNAESFAASGNYINYFPTALTDIHLYSDRDLELSPSGSIRNVYILSFIGLFLLVLACVNFMNLSTAQSLKRAKEVGVRKTLGSNKGDLVRQFLTESGLVSLLSLLLALVFALVALPFFNELSGKAISIPFGNPIFWGMLLAATVVLALFSGSYPAFFMSRFNPVKTLKGSGSSKVGGGKVRNALVVFQFAISVFLIVATLVVFQQLNFIQGKDVGFAKEQVLLIEDAYAAGGKVQTLKDEVLALGQVQNATVSGFLPVPSYRSDTSFFQEGLMDQANAVQAQDWEVDHEYLSTLDIELVAGRDFDRRFATDSTAIIINEATLPLLGINNPQDALGIRLTEDADLKKDNSENMVFYTIIGVIKDFNFESLRQGIGALTMHLSPSSGIMAVKLGTGDYAGTIAAIEGIWNDLAPGQPFSYSFMDESFNATYEAEQRLGKTFMVFAVLSILIACLGLFGLAAFNAQKRTKEIGVRKVLGASVGQITYRLTVDFLKMVGIAIAISLPLGWLAMNKWLEDFSYRIDIPWYTLALAGTLAVVVAVLTVSYQSIRAAITDPVKSLRTE